MGLVFEKVCMDYLNAKNAKGELPILYTSIGRWWGTNAATHGQEEIDLIAMMEKIIFLENVNGAMRSWIFLY